MKRKIPKPQLHLTKNEYIFISVTLFLFATTVLAGRDYIIHHDLYNYGLQADMSWVLRDWAIYYAELQALAIVCAFLARSHRLSLLIFYEFFINSSTQDLIFYGIWGHGAFPTGSWDWMYFAVWFGSWTTTAQVLFSALALSIGVFLAIMLPKRISGYHIP